MPIIFKHVKRRAKIVATLGPKTSGLQEIKDLILAGMNVARVNMSHGSYESHQKVIENIRQASNDLGNREVAILLDLCGPKIRVDQLDSELVLSEGDLWEIVPSSKKDKVKGQIIPTNYEGILGDCNEGDRVLFDDGLLAAKVVTKNANSLSIKIEVGGVLKSKKGINLPDTDVSVPSFTKKDHDDLIFGLENEIDYVALSFVRNKEDIEEVNKFIADRGGTAPVIAKIERPQAVECIDEIIKVAGGIMVARGDMGVEVGNHLVPSIQKNIIRKCNESEIPVITATQMLESMSQNPTPTRAEASDVANAVWDGTDAVMLSGETAVGKYPVETITMMGKIMETAEETPKPRPSVDSLDLSDVTNSFMFSASLISEKVGAQRIVSMSSSGKSCAKLARFRPSIPVLGVTNNRKAARLMCLYWGISPFFIRQCQDADSSSLEYEMMNLVKDKLELKSGDKIVLTRGEGPLFKEGESNSLRIITVENHFEA